MSGDGRDGRSAGRPAQGSHQGLMRALAAMMPWRFAKAIRGLQNESDRNVERSDRIERRLDRIEGRLDALGETLGAQSLRQDDAESTLKTLQDLLEAVNNVRLVAVDTRIDRVETNLTECVEEAARLRDSVMPASEGRWNALFERLTFELEETASLVERILASEPLPTITPDSDERLLAQGLGEVQPLLVEAFRGSEAEVSHRMEDVLPLVKGHAPVLDLGCGRGELLLLLREAGVPAKGIEFDAALVQGAVRRGLEVDQADVLEALGAIDAASVGSITAFHLFEHFSGAMLAAVLEQCRRVLRPGGVLVIECPNPHNLRVGASLFWLDPTHVRPLLPETLSLFLEASGLSVRGIENLHPFPIEQCLNQKDVSGGLGEADRRIDTLESRLDQLLNGPRDYRVVAIKAQGASAK